MPRRLRVEYRTEDSFRREYAQNISRGGVFIPTRTAIEIRESVEVELRLSFGDHQVVLPGEVVHCIPPEMAETGAQPGVAVQFTVPGEELREKLGAFAPTTNTVDERSEGTGRRVAPRGRAHLPVLVTAGSDLLEGHTRNVSSSGLLVSLTGDPPAIGRTVEVCVRHPSSDEELTVAGRVARHVEASGTICVGIEFQAPEARRDEVAGFIDRVRSIEHSRRLGGINGPIADLGIRNLLVMFGSTAPEGMLTLIRGDEEGYITIEDGELRAQLGSRVSREALDAMLAWTHGSFQFEAQADDGLVDGPPVPVSELAGDDAPAPPRPRARPRPPQVERDATAAAESSLSLVDLDDLDLGLDLHPGDEETAEPERARDQATHDDDDEGFEIDLDDVDFDDDEEEEGEDEVAFEVEFEDDDPADYDDVSFDAKADEDADGADAAAAFEIDDVVDELSFDEDDEAGEQDRIDSRLGVDAAPISPDDTLCPVDCDPDRSDLTKIEEAILDLAAVGMTVGKAVDIIPESDAEVYAALETLIDEGWISLSRA